MTHSDKISAKLLALRSSVKPETPAAASEVTLEDLFRSTEGVDRNQPGYHHMCGWNDAIRHVMHLTAALKGDRS